SALREDLRVARREIQVHVGDVGSVFRRAAAPDGDSPGDCAMTSPLPWALRGVRLALGLFDIVYHHEMMERLAWRVSQRREFKLHGARNLAYAVLFLALGLFELKGFWAIVVISVVGAEVVITLIDLFDGDLR